jgi:hypothetical protein
MHRYTRLLGEVDEALRDLGCMIKVLGERKNDAPGDGSGL